MKKIFMLSLALMVLSITASSKDKTIYGFESEGITFAVKGNAKVEVIRPLVKVYFGDVTIPSKATYEGTTYTVVGIGEHAFANMDIDRVSVPATVSYMTEGVFQASHLKSYVWPTSVDRIPEWAFADSPSLAVVKLGDNITSIGSGAFYGCSDLTSIDIPLSVKIIDTLAISNCSRLTKITLNEGLETIGNMAFKDDSRLTELTIPSTVKTIGSEFIDGCDKLSTIKTLSSEPPMLLMKSKEKELTVFKKFGKKGKLVVPNGCANAYRKAAGWSSILNIVEE